MCSDRVLFTGCPVKEAVIAKLILIAIQAIPRILCLKTASFLLREEKEAKETC